MNAPILNRATDPPADGWFQIEVSGENPVHGGRVQVIDDKAVDSIVNRFRAWRESLGEHFGGMLVDADHLSHDLDQRTEAMAWLMDVENRAGQLWGRLDLTGIGAQAIHNKAYKWFSTEYAAEDLEPLGGDRVRPLALGGLAFTNRPKIRGGRPIVNRDGAPTDPNPGELPAGQQQNQTDPTNMQAIAAKLGLSAEATEADILTAIDALLTQQADTAAEAVMNRFADRIPEDQRPAVKARLIANRELTEGMLELLPAPATAAAAATAPIHNRATAKDPDPVTDAAKPAAADPHESARLELVQSIRNRDKCSFERAWDVARLSKPELFTN